MTKREYVDKYRKQFEDMYLKGVNVSDFFALRICEYYEGELKRTGSGNRARRETSQVFGINEITIRRYIAKMAETVRED